MKLKLLACQVDIPPMTTAAEKQAHVRRITQLAVTKLENEKADVVVFPELSNLDYSRAAFDNLDELAETLDGVTCQAYAALAKRCETYVVGGMARVEGDKKFISQVAFDPKGNLFGYYDKIHVAQYGASMEKEYFERGNHMLVFAVKGIRLAPIICYDIRIPELVRTLCIDYGVQCVLHCGANARDESFFSWHHFAVTRAMENQTHLLSLNRAGANFGASVFCPPWVDQENRETVFPNDETLKLVELDVRQAEKMRQAYPFLTDRLEDYRALNAKVL